MCSVVLPYLRSFHFIISFPLNLLFSVFKKIVLSHQFDTVRIIFAFRYYNVSYTNSIVSFFMVTLDGLCSYIVQVEEHRRI